MEKTNFLFTGIFLLIFFTSFTSIVSADTLLDTCRNITLPGRYYLDYGFEAMQSDLPVNDACINILASNVTLDCANNGIAKYELGTYSIIKSSSQNISIYNCNFYSTSTTSSAIFLNGVKDSKLINITTDFFSKSIYLNKTVNSYFENIFSTNGYQSLFMEKNSNNNTFKRLTISLPDFGSTFVLSYSNNNSFIDSNLSAPAIASDPLLLQYSTGNYFYNTKINASLNKGIYAEFSGNNLFYNLYFLSNNSQVYSSYSGNFSILNSRFDKKTNILPFSSKIYIINTTGETRGSEANSEVYKGWYLDSLVVNLSGSPMFLANITIYNLSGSNVSSQLSDINGKNRVILYESSNINGINYYYGNYTVNIYKITYSVSSQSLNMSSNKNITAVLSFLGSLPSITSQPVSGAYDIGQSVTFSVIASGLAPLSYQWKENGVDINGATSSSYTKNNIQPVHSGNSYSVVVTNALGSVTSSVATLTVNPLFIYHNADNNNADKFISNNELFAYFSSFLSGSHNINNALFVLTIRQYSGNYNYTGTGSEDCISSPFNCWAKI